MEEVLKLTALLYLQEALKGQSYEECKELIEVAKQNGAEQGDISGLIAAHLRGDKPGGRGKEQTLGKNRLKSLKEK